MPHASWSGQDSGGSSGRNGRLQKMNGGNPMAASNIDSELVEGVRRFVQKRIAPHSAGWNREGQVPDSELAEMGDMGLFGLLLPEEHGGSGCNQIGRVHV